MSSQWNHPSTQPPHHSKPKRTRTGWRVFWAVFGGIMLAVLLVVGGCSVFVAGGSTPDKPEKRHSQPEKDKGEEGPDTLSQNEAHPPKEDVRLSGVTTKTEFDYKSTSARVTVTNRTSEASDYVVELELLDSSGNRVEDNIVVTDNLKPGKVYKERLDFVKSGGQVKVKSVDRTASVYNH